MKKKRKSEHYIDNQQFFAEMSSWKVLVNEADAKEEKHPPITTYIGECFMKIAENLSRKPNFINYPYRDEMISDGIENCVLYAYNFDPTKSSNPFSYFTQIVYYAFLRRIQKEKKQAYIKMKALEMSDVDSSVKRWINDNYLHNTNRGVETPSVASLTENDISAFENKKTHGSSKKKNPSVPGKPKPIKMKSKKSSATVLPTKSKSKKSKK